MTAADNKFVTFFYIFKKKRQILMTSHDIQLHFLLALENVLALENDSNLNIKAYGNLSLCMLGNFA